MNPSLFIRTLKDKVVLKRSLKSHHSEDWNHYISLHRKLLLNLLLNNWKPFTNISQGWGRDMYLRLTQTNDILKLSRANGMGIVEWDIAFHCIWAISTRSWKAIWRDTFHFDLIGGCEWNRKISILPSRDNHSAEKLHSSQGPCPIPRYDWDGSRMFQ